MKPDSNLSCAKPNIALSGKIFSPGIWEHLVISFVSECMKVDTDIKILKKQ
jgi:hypothetical protein